VRERERANPSSDVCGHDTTERERERERERESARERAKVLQYCEAVDPKTITYCASACAESASPSVRSIQLTVPIYAVFVVKTRRAHGRERG